ncbi:MAG: twin-arginine translocase TatA/TatE family subunit [Phascolarctobacterium sp.]|nr:MAG: twin-arginine translocase TatA/TatE family subunit [Phascolarctobacterium sp.]
MFGLGLPELLLILVIGLIFFGPGKLPEIGSALGKSMKEFKQAVNSTETEIKKAGELAETKAEEPAKEEKAQAEAAK